MSDRSQPISMEQPLTGCSPSRSRRTRSLGFQVRLFRSQLRASLSGLHFDVTFAPGKGSGCADPVLMGWFWRQVLPNVQAPPVVICPRCSIRTRHQTEGSQMRFLAVHRTDSVLTPECRSTSATPNAPGIGAPSKTPTGCYGNTSPKAPTCPSSPEPTLTRLPTRSTPALDRPSDG